MKTFIYSNTPLWENETELSTHQAESWRDVAIEQAANPKHFDSADCPHRLEYIERIRKSTYEDFVYDQFNGDIIVCIKELEGLKLIDVDN